MKEGPTSRPTATAEKSTDSSRHIKLIGRYNESSGCFIRSDRAIDAEYEMPGKPPEPEECEYCHKLRYYYGFLIPQSNIVMQWSKEPETCSCESAQRRAREIIRAEEKEKELQQIRERRARLSRRSGMRARFLTRTFERFIVTDANKQAYNAAKRYADNFTLMLPKRSESGQISPPEIERNGLFISGDYGTGKTHLATAIANELIDRGTQCICMTMIDLLQRVKSSFDSYRRDAAYSDETEESIMRQYEEVPLLIIDDIGSEQPTEWGISKIYAIINARYEAYMPVVITTNYGGEELIQRMTPRGADRKNAEKTLDRLKEMCAGIEMTGASWRTR